MTGNHDQRRVIGTEIIRSGSTGVSVPVRRRADNHWPLIPRYLAASRNSQGKGYMVTKRGSEVVRWCGGGIRDSLIMDLEIADGLLLRPHVLKL